MSYHSKFNIIYRLQKWMDSVPGQTFLNYGYSWGASVVILGALFKLTHLPGANTMLFVGMGTEVVVFFLSAFDRPFDKTDDGKDIPTHVTEEYLETGKVTYSKGGAQSTAEEQPVQQTSGESHASGNTIIIGGGMVPSASPVGQAAEESAASPAEGGAASVPSAAEVAEAMRNQGAWIAQQQQQTPEMQDAQSKYVEELNKLVETLGKVNEQSTRLTRDSEEMENLNRTLTGICKIYEMQLKGASQQVGTIDQINEQTRKMAQQIEQLNKIYARMIEAMTVNMRVAAPGAATSAPHNPEL